MALHADRCARQHRETGARALTRVVFDELLQGVELHPGGDVVAAAVQLADLVVFYVVSFGFLPVSDGEGISTCTGECRGSLVRLGKTSKISFFYLQILSYL